VANGIVTAMRRVDIKVPMVIRLDGTNAEEGREILQTVESEMVISSPNMMDAARRAVDLAGGGK
jgi:succinyl-CoA synthetase beta subunit